MGVVEAITDRIAFDKADTHDSDGVVRGGYCQSTGVVGGGGNGGAVAESDGYDSVDMKRRQEAEKGRFEQAVRRELEMMIMSKQSCEHNEDFI